MDADPDHRLAGGRPSVPDAPAGLAAHHAGHEVVVSSRPDILPLARRRGLTAHAAGPTLEQASAAATERVGAPPWTLSPQEEMAASAALAVRCRGRSPRHDLVTLLRDQRPDIVVHDVLEVGAPAAAEALGIRRSTHSYGPVGDERDRHQSATRCLPCRL